MKVIKTQATQGKLSLTKGNKQTMRLGTKGRRTYRGAQSEPPHHPLHKHKHKVRSISKHHYNIWNTMTQLSGRGTKPMHRSLLCLHSTCKPQGYRNPHLWNCTKLSQHQGASRTPLKRISCVFTPFPTYQRGKK